MTELISLKEEATREISKSYANFAQNGQPTWDLGKIIESLFDRAFQLGKKSAEEERRQKLIKMVQVPGQAEQPSSLT